MGVGIFKGSYPFSFNIMMHTSLACSRKYGIIANKYGRQHPCPKLTNNLRQGTIGSISFITSYRDMIFYHVVTGEYCDNVHDIAF